MLLRDAAATALTASLMAFVAAPAQASGAPAENERVGLPGRALAVARGTATIASSPLDVELRYLISRAIFGNPAFWRYAVMPSPPIQIVVAQGHVTLTGVVQDHMERLLAQSLASQFGALSVRSELRTEAEVRPIRVVSPS